MSEQKQGRSVMLSVSRNGDVDEVSMGVVRHPDMKRLRRRVFLDDLAGVMGFEWLCQAIGYHVCDDGKLETWLFCVHCGRLMQLRDVVVSEEGDIYCPFRGCDGWGLGRDLWWIDDPEDTNEWPAVGDRSVGMLVGWSSDATKSSLPR